MKIFLLSIALGFMSFDFSTVTKEILWQERKLTWKDFTEVPSSKRGGFKAETNSGLRYSAGEENGKIVIKVECYFNPFESWVVKGKETDYLLNHEQRHFDISEIHARLLRQRLEKINNKPIRAFIESGDGPRMQEIYEQTFNDLLKMQDVFDEDTSHSIKTDQQKIWDAKIDAQLEKLKAYAS